MITQIELFNYMAFGGDGAKLRLAPITLIFGPNSSGKTAILKALMMLRQSWEETTCFESLVTVGPYVNQGTFQNVLHRPLGEERPTRMTLGLSCDCPGSDNWTARLVYSTSSNPDDVNGELVTVGFKRAKHSRQTIWLDWEPNLDSDVDDSILYTVAQVTVAEPVEQESPGDSSRPRDSAKEREDALFALLSDRSYNEKSARHKSITREVSTDSKFSADHVTDDQEPGLVEWLQKRSEQWLDHGFLNPTWRGSISVSPGPRGGLAVSPSLTLHAVSKDGSAHQLEAYDFDTLDDPSNVPESSGLLIKRALLAIRRPIFFLNDLGHELSALWRVGPARQAGKRVYIRRGSVPSSVGFDGQGAVALIAAHGDIMLGVNADIQKLGMTYQLSTRENVIQPGVHYTTLTLTEGADGNAREMFLPDVGFGISQVLPVLVERRRLGSADPAKRGTLLVQQPELHLHPAWQANLASVFTDTLPGNETKEPLTNAIIETHSETFVLRLLRLVRERALNRKLVQFAVLEVVDNDKRQLRHVGIAEDGEFDSAWPKGFFPERLAEEGL